MGKPLPAYLIDFLVQQHRDTERDESALRRRDRAIGLRLTADPRRPLDQVCAWLDRLDGEKLPGGKVVAVQRMTNLLLGALGLGLGWATAQVLLHYDGTEPVNVIAVLSVFVGLQLCLLLLLCVTLLPRSLLRYLPGARSLQEGLRALSPGQARRLARRFLPQEVRRTASSLLAAGAAQQRLLGRVEKWALLVSSQTFAVAFNLGALFACGTLIAFTDLAFSWNTTLQMESAQLHRITELLAAPWSWALPQAAPSLELIEATRYFRFQEGTLPYGDAADPARLGQWWPFLVACIAVYGLGPRLLLLVLAGLRYRRSVRYTFRHVQGIDEALDRLNSALVETRARELETGVFAPASLEASGAEETVSPPPPGRRCVIVNWARLVADDETASDLVRRQSGWRPDSVFQAGGARSIEDDSRTVGEIRRATDSKEEPVLVLVKAWEPAMLEFLDFLGDLRRALGEGHDILVMPWGRNAEGALGVPEEGDLQQWRQRVRESGDPWTSVRAPGTGDRP